jgi:hypothetical protein
VLNALKIALLIVSASLAANAFAQNTVYKWTDERGVTQYTQSPPAGSRNYEAVRMGSSGQQRSAEPTQDTADTNQARAASPAPLTPADLERQEYCDAARRNLAALESEASVHIEAADGGEATPLDAEQRAEQIEIAQRQVSQFCRD